MQIKRLKLSGFKSFVDATELRIEPGLTGIVGPNGCGKSNLLEAIRWVMGESSAKSMRGGGMEDVIFAGTTSRPQRDFAEVSLLTIQEQGELFNAVDVGADGELEVTRRIERGAGSAYRANGKDVRAKDVALIFADAATGAHSPALVSQGRIAAVIAARPQERRAMLEEAAGIAGLHVRRKDAEQKLRAAEGNLARLDEILADMDSRAGNLRRQARAAERYIRLSEQIRISEGRVIFARWREANASAEAARAEAKMAEATVGAAQEALTAANVHSSAAVTALAERRAEALATRDAASESGHQLNTLKAERDGVVRRLHDLAQQAARLDEDREREGTLANDAAEAIARLTAEVASLKARIAETEAMRPDFAARIARAEDGARDAELELARAMAKQAGEQAELRVAEAALAAARSLEGYMAEVEPRVDGSVLLLENHCPICAAAQACQQFCRSELDASGACWGRGCRWCGSSISWRGRGVVPTWSARWNRAERVVAWRRAAWSGRRGFAGAAVRQAFLQHRGPGRGPRAFCLRQGDEFLYLLALGCECGRRALGKDDCHVVGAVVVVAVLERRIEQGADGVALAAPALDQFPGRLDPGAGVVREQLADQRVGAVSRTTWPPPARLRPRRSGRRCAPGTGPVPAGRSARPGRPACVSADSGW